MIARGCDSEPLHERRHASDFGRESSASAYEDVDTGVLRLGAPALWDAHHHNRVVRTDARDRREASRGWPASLVRVIASTRTGNTVVQTLLGRSLDAQIVVRSRPSAVIIIPHPRDPAPARHATPKSEMSPASIAMATGYWTNTERYGSRSVRRRVERSTERRATPSQRHHRQRSERSGPEVTRRVPTTHRSRTTIIRFPRRRRRRSLIRPSPRRRQRTCNRQYTLHRHRRIESPTPSNSHQRAVTPQLIASRRRRRRSRVAVTAPAL